ncbi:MAG: HPP family protein [Deltaproteobacteria bacterium]|nr:HPP family protein [Deltaproteobacteria bacterium]
MKEYFKKMRGGGESPPGVGFSEIVWSGIGSFAGIAACGYLSARYFTPLDLTLFIGSFGASAVLIYAAIKSPLAQPRNLIGGHVLSGLVGVTCYKFFGHDIMLASALAVSLAIMVMLATKTLHPPGGATALIAVIGGKAIYNLGYLYAIIPAGLGAAVLLVIALLVNNLSKNRKYPEYWF